ncbi:MAG: hypothetical protein RMM17_10160 [Acidobacteriota bacterium]|nr:hypothetical protein [Blastocatellia bacterium]MDW8413033.1 hypothetical protein [Acidobacteriota bacterium]
MYKAALLILVLCITGIASDELYELKQIKITLLDSNGAAWNDTNAYLGVRLDAAKNEALSEVGTGTLTYVLGEDYKRYSLRIEAGNCVADVPFVVYKQQDKVIYYELTMLRKEGERYVSIPLSTRTIAVSATSKEKVTLRTSIVRPMLMTDWLLYGGIMAASTLAVYFLFFRWLFTVLLFQHGWPVSRAEYFTTSLSLLVLVAIFGFLLVLFIPQTVVTWTILVLLTILWVGHAIVWALS